MINPLKVSAEQNLYNTLPLCYEIESFTKNNLL